MSQTQSGFPHLDSSESGGNNCQNRVPDVTNDCAGSLCASSKTLVTAAFLHAYMETIGAHLSPFRFVTAIGEVIGVADVVTVPIAWLHADQFSWQRYELRFVLVSVGLTFAARTCRPLRTLHLLQVGNMALEAREPGSTLIVTTSG